MYNIRNKQYRAITTISSAVPQVVVPAQSGYVVGIVDVHVVNLSAFTASVTLYEESTKLMPSIPLGASGTFLTDMPGDKQLTLIRGSGVKASVSPAGSAEVQIVYLLHDDRTPISKQTARVNTYTNALAVKATRAPNIRGDQVEG